MVARYAVRTWDIRTFRVEDAAVGNLYGRTDRTFGL